MKKLFALIPIIGLVLGIVAIATEINAKTTLPQYKADLHISQNPITAFQYGYVAAFQK